MSATTCSSQETRCRRVLGLVGALAVLSEIDLSEHLSSKQVFSGFYAFAMLAFFGHRVFREWKLMKASAR